MSVSRREFLAGSAAAAASPALIARIPAGSPGKVLGPGPVELLLAVNGRERRLEVEPRTTLLEALRWKLGITGPKEVCDRGACGACTVLVDGSPRLACMTLAVEMAGSSVTTVEGLGSSETPGRVQEALLHHDAVQCGYCIPGFVTTLEGALRRNPRADTRELKRAIAGNLCRCGTYSKIFEAAARLAGEDPPAGEPQRNAAACLEKVLGRVDGGAKITGEAVYSADAGRPGLLFAQHVPCPYGRATLTGADLETVRRLPGVIEAEAEVGGSFEFSGAPAGFVCAESPAALRDAMTALRLEWEPELPETDPLRLHEEEHGAFPPAMAALARGSKGRAALAALEKADLVLERTYRTQVQNHCTLEPHGGMVDPVPEPPEAWMSTQGTFSCVSGVARGLGRPPAKVAVKCDYVGGGFGSKFGAGREGLLAAQLAARHGRPVRVFNDREYEHLDTGNRPGSIQWMRIGARRDGKLLGGFVYTAGLVGFDGGGGGVSNPSPSWYDFGSIAARHRDVHMPHGIPRPFRAPGKPQGLFAIESMVDELGERLGMDPIAMRLKNETSAVRRAMYAAGAAEIGWDRRQPAGSQTGRLRSGLGVAGADWGNRGGRCDIRMRALPDATVEVFSGTQDIGTGQRTVLADCAAGSLGVPRVMVRVRMADSRYPFGPASGGSVTARLTAPAVQDAAARLLQAIPGLGGKKPEDPIAWRSACRQLPAGGLEAKGSFNRKYWGEGSSDCVQFAQVLVDAETGVVRVEKIVALQACGLAVNRLTAENQIVGGVTQGLSYALFEDKVVDPQLGCQLNSDLLAYKIAGALDVPEIVPLLWPREEGMGVRSLGEPVTVPTAAAIANAVANALGARVRELPITPARVLAALEERA